MKLTKKLVNYYEQWKRNSLQEKKSSGKPTLLIGRDKVCMTIRALKIRDLNKDTIGIYHDGRPSVWGWEPEVVGECTGAKNDDHALELIY